MSEEIVLKEMALKECPVPWCKGRPLICNWPKLSLVQCKKCAVTTGCFDTPEEAIAVWENRDSISALERNLITLVENWVDSPEGMYATSWQVSGIIKAVGEIRKERAGSVEDSNAV